MLDSRPLHRNGKTGHLQYVPRLKLCFGLTALVGKIIRAEQHKHRDVVEDSFEAIHTDLRAWEEQLPDALRYRVDEQSSELKVFAAMLVLAFQLVESRAQSQHADPC